MRRRQSAIWATGAAISVFGALASVATADLLTAQALDELGMQRYWQARLPLVAGESISRISLLDDNLYALTDGNRAYAIHAHTGVLRWSRDVADPELTVRGPSHAAAHVFFTTPGGVRVIHRRTGESAGEPRRLKGRVVEVAHDIAEINIGRLHGVRLGNILQVFRPGRSGLIEGQAFAQLRITSIQPRRSKGRLVQLDTSRRALSGDMVAANVVLPLAEVKLPFAASSAAVADDRWIYVGAANQRFYKLDILTGFQAWQLPTPRTVSATPVLHAGNLYYAGQDGLVVSCTSRDRIKNWTFQTEGPIFADPVVTRQRVFVASSDRSLYCLDRVTGRLVWRQRFDNPLDAAPTIAGSQVYQEVPLEGLHVLDAATGKRLWQRRSGGRPLMRKGDDLYLWGGNGSAFGRLEVLSLETAELRRSVAADQASFAAAHEDDGLILLVSRGGEVMCLRSKDAPHLRPEQLLAVLKNDRLAKAPRVQSPAAAEAPPPARAERRLPLWRRLLFDDWVASRSKVRPVGGRGLVEVETDDPEEEEADPEEEEEEDPEEEDPDEEEEEEDPDG